MLEFIFFNQEPQQRFVDLAQEHSIEITLNREEESWIVQLPEDIDDKLVDLLEQRYDELMELDQRLTEQHDNSDDALHSAGITIQLKNGDNVYARVPPDLLNRVLQCISHEELNLIVNAIVEAVESPQTTRLCQKI